MNTSSPIYTHLRQQPNRTKTGPYYNSDDLACLERTYAELESSRPTDENPGLLLGKIQSGKTKSFIGLMGLCFDNGYDVIVVLTKNSQALAEQTTKRMTKVFGAFKRTVFVNDVMLLPAQIPPYIATQKLVLVAKKEHRNIKHVLEHLTKAGSPFLKKKTLIIDDEADNASVSYIKKRDEDDNEWVEMAKVADLVNKLRRNISESRFLQVTATPYSLFLQNEGPAIKDRPETFTLRPKFVELVPVNPDYVGGDYYFGSNVEDESHPSSKLFVPVEDEERPVLKTMPNRNGFRLEKDCLTSERVCGLRRAVASFVTAGCIRRLQMEKAGSEADHFAFLLHTEAKKESHRWQDDLVQRLVYDMVNAKEAGNQGRVVELLSTAYEDLAQSVKLSKGYLPSLREVLSLAETALANKWLNPVLVNSDEDVRALLDPESGELKLDAPLTMFVGGQYMDRGVTVPNLIGFYYGRSPRTFQQDTVLQHCRMFGFRSPADCAVTRFYTSTRIYGAMVQMHQTDTLLRGRIEKKRFKDCLYILEKQAGGGIRFCNFSKVRASRVNFVDAESKITPLGFQTVSPTDLKAINRRIEKHLSEVGATATEGQNHVIVPAEKAAELIEDLSESFGEFTSGYEDTWNKEDVLSLLSVLTASDEEGGPQRGVAVMIRRNRNRPYHQTPTDTPDNPDNDMLPARRVASSVPVLLLMQQNGKVADKWRGEAFWWPMIFPPDNERAYIYAGGAKRTRRKK
jgi:hypothetical protein